MADEVSAKKSRVTKDVGEAFTVLLLLAWNDIVVNGDKMSVSQIESVMKVKAADWVPILIDQYRHIPMKDVSAQVLKTQINLDSGQDDKNKAYIVEIISSFIKKFNLACGLVRKAKEAIAYVVNVLNPHWKDPTSFASGTQHIDALLVVRKAAWKKNEEEKKKVHLKKGANYIMREYEATWQSKEWMAFRYLGLAAGRYLF